MLNKKRQLAFRMLKFTPPKDEIYEKLPEAYKKFHCELHEAKPKPVHYIPEKGRWKKDPDTGVITPVQNVPIPTMFPKQLNNVLLGGEMVVRGFEKRHPRDRRVPHFWVPILHRSVVYSEVLDKHFSAIVTHRLILQIHEHKGFDQYLLQNSACDLKTKLALTFKKEILSALLHKTLPYNEEKNEEIYEKYKQYIIPAEELEWYGLSYDEACKKQSELEEEARINVIPLKHRFRVELLEELRQKEEDMESNTIIEEKQPGWLSKIAKPFGPKS